MKALIAATAALVLSGCGLPPTLIIASYALDGMSLLSTGKSVSDHAISAAAEKDCAVWRFVKDGSVCREYEGADQPLVLTAERWDADPTPASSAAGDTPSKPVMLALADPTVLPQFADDGAESVSARDSRLGIRLPSGPVAATFAAIAQAPDPDMVGRGGTVRTEASIRRRQSTAWDAARGKVLVLGSFTRLENAKRAARRWTAFRPAIIRTRLDGAMHHRVIVRPRDTDRAQRQMASLGQHVWAADVCAPGVPGAGCVNLPAAFPHHSR